MVTRSSHWGLPQAFRLTIDVGLAERGQRRAEGPQVGLDQSRARVVLRFRQLEAYSLWAKGVKLATLIS